MIEPRTLRTPAILLLFLGFYLTARGYHSRDGDQAYRLPLLLHRQDPSAFADDPFVRALDDFNPHGGYLALLDLASRPLGLSAALFGLFAATFFLTAFGAIAIARSAWPEGGRPVGLVAFGLILATKAGNIGTNHLFEAMLLDRQVGFSLGWVALALALRGETWRPSLAIGLAATIHPSVGLQWGGLLGTSWVAWAIVRRSTGQDRRTAAIGVSTLALVLVPSVLEAARLGGRLFEGLSAEDFWSLGVELQMSQHMVPSSWRASQWLAWACLIGLGIASLAVANRVDRRPEVAGPRTRARLAITLAIVLAGLAAAAVAIEGWRHPKITVFQPFRMATVARGLALIFLAGRCRSLWVEGGSFGRVRVGLLVAGVSGDRAMVVVALVESAIGLHGWLGGRSAVAPFSSALPTRVVGLATLAAGLAFLSRHDTERGHLALMAGGLAALVVSTFLERRWSPRGWTSPRLAVALLACWSLPTAAWLAGALDTLPGHVGEALIARCRFEATPSDEIERLGVWVSAFTPQDARFVTPPGPKTFRLWSGRSVAFNRSASPYHAEGLKDWSARFRQHVAYRGSTPDFVRSYLDDRHGLESRFNRLTPRELADLARSQGADHVLAAAPGDRDGLDPDGSLRVLRVEGRYAIYRVEPEAIGAKTARRLDPRGDAEAGPSRR